MKFRLLEYLRCPECLGILKLSDVVIEQPPARSVSCDLAPCSGVCPFPEQLGRERDCDACAGYEVSTGMLHCAACESNYRISDGVPCLRGPSTFDDVEDVERTAVSFGFLWGKATPFDVPESQRYHYAKMERALALRPLQGLVLDAGCGEGIDLVDVACRTGVEVIGVDVSSDGCRASLARTTGLPNTHVVQADLACLPFGAVTFDMVYSYGVLHHVPAPSRAAAELARVGRADAGVAVYLYEDFGERSAGLRFSLRLVNSLRRITTRIPPSVLFFLCRMASPLVYLTCTVPFLIFKRIPLLRTVAFGLPFRHGRGPFRLTGDLYDRFSAPLEYRYSRGGAACLLEQAGLAVTCVKHERGWMVAARKPGAPASA